MQDFLCFYHHCKLVLNPFFFKSCKNPIFKDNKANNKYMLKQPSSSQISPISCGESQTFKCENGREKRNHSFALWNQFSLVGKVNGNHPERVTVTSTVGSACLKWPLTRLSSTHGEPGPALLPLFAGSRAKRNRHTWPALLTTHNYDESCSKKKL